MPVSEPLATLTKHWQVRDSEAKRGTIDLKVFVALAHVTHILQEERARNDIPLPPFPLATDGPMEMLQNGHKALAGWTGPGVE